MLKSEVEKFAEAGKISETVSFGASELKYSLVMSSGADAIHAEFADNELIIFFPENTAREWTTNDNVGFETEQAVGSNQTLTIIVEKDFVCVDRPNDPDREDAYPNPNVTC